MELPSISIVTPSYNQGQFLEETINSVLNQNYPNLQYFIFDGGSTDGSVDIIKKYESKITFWVSEKDTGQANAINKGLQYCTGEIFNWLNSDDYLTDGALFKIADCFTNSDVDLVAGKVNNFSSTESDIVANKALTATNLLTWKYGTHFYQPGVWMRKKYLIDCGGLDEQFHYAFDWDLLIRYLHLFGNVKYIDDVLVNFRLHGGSKTVQLINRFEEEERKIIEKIAGEQKFIRLKNVCDYKTNRTKWFNYLNHTLQNDKIGAPKKLISILRNLSEQPKDWAVTKMTLGAIKRIILHQNEFDN